MHTQKLRAGDKVGRWTVLGEPMLTEKGSRKWLCRCDCGTERYVLERSLLYGGSQSCGCMRREHVSEAASPDLTGMRFGELTVIEHLPSAKSGAARWLCKCTCGSECTVYASHLLGGKRTCCVGHIHKKNFAYCDISGQRFGRLVALYPLQKTEKRKSVIWHCRCDCGKETDVSYNSLMYSNQKSCGCRKTEHGKKLNGYLTHVAGTSVDMLRSRKIPSDNTTGCKGVYFIRGKYMAKIVFQKKQYCLGTYEKIEDAVKARKEAEKVFCEDVVEHYERWKRRADRNPVWAKENPVQINVVRTGDQLNVILLPPIDETQESCDEIDLVQTAVR